MRFSEMKVHIFGFLAVIFLLSGCTNNAIRRIDPETIANDFSTDPEISVRKYRRLWSSKESIEEVSSVDRITIAGELMSYDRQNYSEYYDFVVKNISSDNEVAAAAAANSLRNAKGVESIELLFVAMESKNPVVGRAAAHSLNYRMTTLKHSSEKSSEHALMFNLVSEKCGASSMKNYIRSVICGQEIKQDESN